MYRNREKNSELTLRTPWARQHFNALGLGREFAEAIGAVDHCRKIRNQFAHCQWDGDGSKSIAFVTLEDLAKPTAMSLALSKCCGRSGISKVGGGEYSQKRRPKPSSDAQNRRRDHAYQSTTKALVHDVEGAWTLIPVQVSKCGGTAKTTGSIDHREQRQQTSSSRRRRCSRDDTIKSSPVTGSKLEDKQVAPP